jgi:uncharacterized protein (UPF0332 family)
VRSLFNRRFVKTGAVAGELSVLYNDLFENRNKGDYEDLAWFEEGRVCPWLDQARRFVAAIEDLVEPPAEEPVMPDPIGRIIMGTEPTSTARPK